MGSSPRLRGTRGEERGLDLRAGIIPALAGNTGVSTGAISGYRDHPRACGEHCLLGFVDEFLEGSSPRLRGTLSNGRVAQYNFGIIPALAGNTAQVVSKPIRAGDHPRACGEHDHQPVGVWFAQGSSPRLRGTLAAGPVVRVVPGIIPALAGNTSVCWLPVVVGGDHPRACGEHIGVLVARCGRWGSSPRLRGTLG